MPFHDILVIKPSSMGDVVHTLPAVALLKRVCPEARLRWLVNPEWAPLLEGNPDVDEIIPFPRRSLGGLANLPKQIRWLRETAAHCPADLVLDFQGLLRSAIIGRACRSREGTFLGLSDAREGARFFYDRAISAGKPGQEHAVNRYLKLAAAATETVPTPPASLDWRLPAGDRPTGFSLEKPFLLLHPFSRGSGKSLSVEETEAFCRAFPHPVVLAGRADAEVELPANGLNLLNQTTLPELIWLIRQARFVVSVDSGPMHIAAALTPNLLSIHTWSDPALVGPYRPEAWVWKDRTLFQASEIGRPLPPGAKPFTIPDVKAMAAFVAQRWENL